jgi:dGTPase
VYSEADEVREVIEPRTVRDEPFRSAYRRDYARLIHSPAFRRLQGKTQVFPPHESDFFRNRLTHSLEVAQIAKSIALKLNYESALFKKFPIIPDIVETAALAHDLGHPPFGHNGERALDDSLKGCGGFEGNAQTFRIISRLEKKTSRGASLNELPQPNDDARVGLNWTRRSLAAIIKYDEVIPIYRNSDSQLVKGIYDSDSAVFQKVKMAVCPDIPNGVPFKTIEASIMDLADDIAYSTFDLEDALKSGFIDLLDIIDSPHEIYDRVATKVAKALNRQFSADDVRIALYDLLDSRVGFQKLEHDHTSLKGLLLNKTVKSFSENGYFRTGLTTELVGEFVRAVRVNENDSFPVLSNVYLENSVAAQVECLKHFTFEAMIMSPRLRVAEGRGYDVVEGIFKKLDGKKGYLFMPADCRALYQSQSDDSKKKRVLADFIAGMTDRYAVEYYGRLVSDNPASIFKDI